MKPAVGNDAQRRPKQPSQRPQTQVPSRSVNGFPISSNQFQILQDSELAMSTSPSQIPDRLIDPRKTRLARQRAARGTTDEQGTLGNVANEGILYTVPPGNDKRGNLYNGRVDQPVSSGIRHSFFPNSLSVSPSDILYLQSDGNVQNLLETGVVNDDAMYSNDVNDVACTDSQCNKRISVAGQEWSAGQLGNKPIGAREVARNTETCLGPYATCDTMQPHTGHNTHGSREASSGLPQQED